MTLVVYKYLRGVMRNRVRLISGIVFVGCLMIPASIYADELPRAQIAAGYSYLRVISADIDYPSGWFASGTWNVTDVLGISGEVGGSSRSSQVPGLPALNSNEYNVMGGLRVGRRSPIAPFAQALIGLVRFTNSFNVSESDFGMQFGGGLDLKLYGPFGARVEADYRSITIGGCCTNQFRFATGIVFTR